MLIVNCYWAELTFYCIYHESISFPPKRNIVQLKLRMKDKDRFNLTIMLHKRTGL